MTSARSNLNADIHLLDNAAARAGHLLEIVAGDAGGGRRPPRGDRRSALADRQALHRRRRGDDLPRAAHARVRAPARRARFGRYDDGAWGHPSWRARAQALVERFAARLDPAESGPIDVAIDLDDPAVALKRFDAAYPSAATSLLHPADAQFFLEVCDRDGKPVPFVPVLDGEVRRWYMADGLWQAQDDRLDADEVFVIPGPEAVAGITRADEPVAELLARFEAAAIAREVATPWEERERLAIPAPTRPGAAARSPRCSPRSASSARTAARTRTRCGG